MVIDPPIMPPINGHADFEVGISGTVDDSVGVAGKRSVVGGGSITGV